MSVCVCVCVRASVCVCTPQLYNNLDTFYQASSIEETPSGIVLSVKASIREVTDPTHTHAETHIHHTHALLLLPQRHGSGR